MADGTRRLPPPGVAERLGRLRALHVPERDADARRRLAAQPRLEAEPFAATVARRIEELRALCELANHLHLRLVRSPSNSEVRRR